MEIRRLGAIGAEITGTDTGRGARGERAIQVPGEGSLAGGCQGRALLAGLFQVHEIVVRTLDERHRHLQLAEVVDRRARAIRRVGR